MENAEMSPENKLFILAGNGPYDNRGCEAIVRGTVEILRQHFDNPKFVVISFFNSSDQFRKQVNNEIDSDIMHKGIFPPRRFEPMWFLNVGIKKLFPKVHDQFVYNQMLFMIKNSDAILSIGGDNYTIDYGIPREFVNMDNLVLSKSKPLIIWGASVGPFNRMPEFESFMIKHLKKVSGIFARESITVEYLAKNGIIDNVYRVADPAFLMEPIKPEKSSFDLDILKSSIGINLSPLMAKYITSNNLDEWTKYCVNIIKMLLTEFKRPIFLIPHVTIPFSNDHSFLRNILSLLSMKDQIELVSPNLNAAETKWLISKLYVFVGARTHSTIAALSSSVPTLSLSYSIKAKGINLDIYDNDHYCITPSISSPNVIVEKVGELLQNRENISNWIKLRLPKIKSLAMDSGRYLKEIINYGS